MQMYDWNFTTVDGESFKFFHTEKVMTVEDMWRVVRATEIKSHPDCAVLRIETRHSYHTITFRNRSYCVVPMAEIAQLWYTERTPAAERINLYELIQGECGEV